MQLKDLNTKKNLATFYFWNSYKFQNQKLSDNNYCSAPYYITFNTLLSALKAYPFDLRLILYLTPLILILMGIGLDFIVTKYPSFANPLSLLTIIPILFIGIKIINKQFPLQREEIKSSYNFLKTKIKAED